MTQLSFTTTNLIDSVNWALNSLAELAKLARTHVKIARQWKVTFTYKQKLNLVETKYF